VHDGADLDRSAGGSRVREQVGEFDGAVAVLDVDHVVAVDLRRLVVGQPDGQLGVREQLAADQFTRIVSDSLELVALQAWLTITLQDQ
jgi:hypothetical protein